MILEQKTYPKVPWECTFLNESQRNLEAWHKKAVDLLDVNQPLMLSKYVGLALYSVIFI